MFFLPLQELKIHNFICSLFFYFASNFKFNKMVNITFLLMNELQIVQIVPQLDAVCLEVWLSSRSSRLSRLPTFSRPVA